MKYILADIHFTFTTVYVINKKSIGDMLSVKFQNLMAFIMLIFVVCYKQAHWFAGLDMLKFFEQVYSIICRCLIH